MRDHRNIDERGRAFGQAIADKLRKDRSLVSLAHANIDRWLKTAPASVHPALHEWRQILAGDVEDVMSILTESSERATRLRQSNPFAGALTKEERNEILQRFHKHEQASA